VFGAIKNGQSRDTGNIGYTGRRQTNTKKHNTIQKNKKTSYTNPFKEAGVNPDAHEG